MVRGDCIDDAGLRPLLERGDGLLAVQVGKLGVGRVAQQADGVFFVFSEAKVGR